MKSALLETIKKMEYLLRQCGWDDRAEWFRTRREALESLPIGSSEFNGRLREIDGILVGMGSFSDAPMYPKGGANISRKEALEQQWNLTEEAGQVIESILSESEKR